MAETAVIYKSRYGSVKQYAKWLAGALDADLFELDAKTHTRLSPYKTIIYGGGLYAGSIAGIARFKKIFNTCADKRFMMFTVGLTPTDKPEALAPIIAKAFTPEMHAKIKVFHLRGGIDYKQLGLFHRLIMAAVSRLISKTPAESLGEAEKSLLSTYGKTVSFIDEASLEPLLGCVLSVEDTGR